jgi:hypothetical protein
VVVRKATIEISCNANWSPISAAFWPDSRHDGNVSDSFTQAKWENINREKGDDSLQSRVATLANPHGIQPRIFALRTKTKEQGLVCYSPWVQHLAPRVMMYLPAIIAMQIKIVVPVSVLSGVSETTRTTPQSHTS